jgi:hypothetical protein
VRGAGAVLLEDEGHGREPGAGGVRQGPLPEPPQQGQGEHRLGARMIADGESSDAYLAQFRQKEWALAKELGPNEMSVEELRHYRATGEKPARIGKREPKTAPKRKSKYNAVKTKLDGHTFDSKLEAAFYEYLKADPSVVHIDVHPVFTLAEGIRYRADFCAWFISGQEVYDCKGMKPTTDYKRIKALFNAHPLRPLVTVYRSKGAWRFER